MYTYLQLRFLVSWFLQAFWASDGPGGKCYGFQTMLEDPDRRPIGIVYDATSARGNPALAGFINSPEGFEEDVSLVVSICLRAWGVWCWWLW
jgi:hypothetical protein